MLNKIISQIKPLLRRVARYQYLLIGGVIVALFAYTVSVINSELSPERDEDRYNQARLNIEKVEFDEDSVKTIVRLRDLNIDVEAIFAPGRTNPFE